MDEWCYFINRTNVREREVCKVIENEKTQRGKDTLIEKLEMLNDDNLTYFLLVAQALIEVENQEELCSLD